MVYLVTRRELRVRASSPVATEADAFSEDVLRIEISGPDGPHLTIVDLPGLIIWSSRCAKRHSRGSLGKKNDYANQIVLKLARDADMEGHRTQLMQYREAGYLAMVQLWRTWH